MHKTLQVVVEGRPYIVVIKEVTEEDNAPASTASVTPAPVTPPTQAAGNGKVEVSPLTGVVDAVDVAVGTSVKPGDRILVIEAMKMKTSIHANHAGAVSDIAVKVGDAVDAGQTLLWIA